MKSILENLLLLSHLFLVSRSIGNGFFILKDLNCDNFNLLKVKIIFFFFFCPSKSLTWYWGSARISLIPTSGPMNWLLEVRGMKIGTRWFARQNHLLFSQNLVQTSVTLCDVVGILATLANSLGILRSWILSLSYSPYSFLLFWKKLKVIYYLSTIYDQLLNKCGRGIRKSLQF